MARVFPDTSLNPLNLDMAFKKIFLKAEENTGFGVNSNNSGGRFFKKDGSPNVKRTGQGFLNRYSWYHTLLELSRGKFLLLMLAGYLAINLVFAGLYYAVGIEHLEGVHTGSEMKNFSEVFFFSTQTFTTVGYGRISPTGFSTSLLATLEAFLGLLSFAIITGLFYGRFSRPQAFLKFSDIAVIAPYQDGIALMFRMAPFKNNMLSEAEVKLTMAMEVEENGVKKDKFYNLDMAISRINTLSLSWTIVHPLDEKSPLAGFTKEDIAATEMEIFVFVKAFDEVFANTVVARTSYLPSEIIWGAKFRLMYHPTADGSSTLLDSRLLNAYDHVTLPEPVTIPV